MSRTLERLIDQLTVLEPLADALQGAVGRLLEQGGPAAKSAKDILNGVWFKHPLHPAATDIPLGAWTCATLLDLAGDRRLEPAAEALVGVGCVGAVGAALTGLADWQDTYGGERRVGLTHALLNVLALGLFSSSWALRRRGARGQGISASLLGYGVALLSSYLGGDLVFRRGTQVNRTAWLEGPEGWTPVATEADLAEGKLVRSEAAGVPVLLVRQNGRIAALSAVCPHAGGPLDEGTLEGSTIICPWHASQFELSTGAIVHGPATVEPPVYETRVQEGQVEVRRAKGV